MSLYCYTLGPNINIMKHKLNHVEAAGSCFLPLNNKSPKNLTSHISFVSNFNNKYSSPMMEEDNKMLSESEDYSNELDVAVKAMQMACFLYQKLQDTLVSMSTRCNDQVQFNDDNSLLTIAGWSVQAIVRWILSQSLGSENISILAKGDVQTLSKTNASEVLEAVVKTVNECIAEAPRFGVQELKSALGSSEVLELLSHCNSVGAPSARFWVLGSIDDTLGYVNGDQYVVSLSLIEAGEVVLGVIGCPNYPMRKEWLSYHHSYHRIISMLTPTTSETWNKGCVIYAKKGSGKAWMQPVVHVNKKFVWPNHAKQVSISSIDNPALATFCETVEKANSSHSFTEGLALSVGLSKRPLRALSMMKYVAIACGNAEVFMKFARASYKEKIWDHAAGVIIIQEAGGIVTDVRGDPLDFSKGLYLEGLDRGIVACAGPTLHEKIIDAVDASWSSSCL
ncbi:hypothetical protein Lal_00015955 [Lupinus albus]|uniref:3'(2'),5'-bisphosphate nucleotidase n=1 Tax=Lupinus albus TaxID=3870 RepID=A0A6A4QJB0_LUPAL|nr:putative 3'(2'),5'-bisphosphate nucleotidase [Lupinus albus]KAF1872853.1 hypothetical protein Lal_00015955 [Lupinus albus]